MTIKKVTVGDAPTRFNKAEHYLKLAQADSNDPTSDNLIYALDGYFASIAAAQIEMIAGLNDLLDRVDKIQKKLGM